jgi:hypothetical protein
MHAGCGVYFLIGRGERKLTFRGSLIVSTPHQIRSILNQKAEPGADGSHI